MPILQRHWSAVFDGLVDKDGYRQNCQSAWLQYAVHFLYRHKIVVDMFNDVRGEDDIKALARKVKISHIKADRPSMRVNIGGHQFT